MYNHTFITKHWICSVDYIYIITHQQIKAKLSIVKTNTCFVRLSHFPFFCLFPWFRVTTSVDMETAWNLNMCSLGCQRGTAGLFFIWHCSRSGPSQAAPSPARVLLSPWKTLNETQAGVIPSKWNSLCVSGQVRGGVCVYIYSPVLKMEAAVRTRDV